MHLGYDKSQDTARCAVAKKEDVSLNILEVDCIECLESFHDDLDSEIENFRYDLKEVKEDIRDLKAKRKEIKKDARDARIAKKDALVRLEELYKAEVDEYESEEDGTGEDEGEDEPYNDDDPEWTSEVGSYSHDYATNR